MIFATESWYLLDKMIGQDAPGHIEYVGCAHQEVVGLAVRRGGTEGVERWLSAHRAILPYGDV
jgi:hypothetical protein